MDSGSGTGVRPAIRVMTIVGDVLRLQGVHLFPDGSIQTGVAGMKADSGPPSLFCRLHDGQDLLQGHLRAVVDGAVRFAQLQQRRIHQTAGVDDHVRRFQKLRPPEGDEVRRTGPRSHEMNHNLLLYDDGGEIPRLRPQVLKIPADLFCGQAAVPDHGGLL